MSRCLGILQPERFRNGSSRGAINLSASGTRMIKRYRPRQKGLARRGCRLTEPEGVQIRVPHDKANPPLCSDQALVQLAGCRCRLFGRVDPGDGVLDAVPEHGRALLERKACQRVAPRVLQLCANAADGGSRVVMTSDCPPKVSGLVINSPPL